ncbi:hypothetical protein, partial [Citrobacter youngae]|uniref:hypothetical protein n=1 Tax=Citrobacter youngae TaxID=133448 RepID=UPI001952DE0E
SVVLPSHLLEGREAEQGVQVPECVCCDEQGGGHLGVYHVLGGAAQEVLGVTHHQLPAGSHG